MGVCFIWEIYFEVDTCPDWLTFSSFNKEQKDLEGKKKWL